MICDKCGKDRPRVGPFRDKGVLLGNWCGGCKIGSVLTDPVRKAKLERDAQAFAAAVLADDPKAKA